MAGMYLMCGHIASGKSYFAKRFAEKNSFRLLDVDECYRIYNGDERIHENKFEVWILFYELIHRAAMLGQDVVVDTNAPLISHRDELLSWFPEFDTHHLIWIDASPELAWENNCGRERVVDREAFNALVDMFQEPTAGEDRGVLRSSWDTICRVDNIENCFREPVFIQGNLELFNADFIV